VALDFGADLANATPQQRPAPVRLFYDHLSEEGPREPNPVGRGRCTPGGKFGRHRRGLVPRLTKLPGSRANSGGWTCWPSCATNP
jgi:hypothetical protein